MVSRNIDIILLASQRAVEDAEFPEEDALADRDAANDELTTTIQSTRLALASRALGADKVAPYILIFPEGISYFIQARLSQQRERYEELHGRLTAFLPAKDPVRVETIPLFVAQLDEWKVAEVSVTTARTALTLAKTRRDAATTSWRETLEKTYGWLVSQVGRQKADRFFPRAGRRIEKAESGETSEPGA